MKSNCFYGKNLCVLCVILKNLANPKIVKIMLRFSPRILQIKLLKLVYDTNILLSMV